jgi:hypothetical protein
MAIGAQGGATSDLAVTSAYFGGPEGEPPKPDRLMVQSQTAYRDVRKINIYDFIEHTYFGTKGYRDGYYLIPHPREAYYETRRATSYYNNVFRAVLNAMVDDVFADRIARECQSEAFTAFINNCDSCGTPLQNMIEDAMHFGRMHDIVFIVMDNYRAEEQPRSAADAARDRVLPYIYLKKAVDVKEWRTDRFGKLTSIDFADEVLTELVSEGGRTVEKTYRTWRHWEDGRWELYRTKPSEDGSAEVKVPLAAGAIGIPGLPVIPMLDFARTDNLKTMPHPSTYDLAFLCFALFNKESEMRTLEQYQAFSIFYAQGIDLQTVTIGPQNLWLLPGDAKIPPGVITPNPEHLKNHQESCDRLAQQIRQNAGQKGVLTPEPRQSGSGISKEWDFRGEEKVLRRTSLAALNLELRIAALFRKFTGEQFDYFPAYPEKFGPGYKQEKLMLLQQFIRESPPEAIAERLWREAEILLFGSRTEPPV